MRRLLVGGNWKCNGTAEFSRTFPTNVLKAMSFSPSKVDVVVAPNFMHLAGA